MDKATIREELRCGWLIAKWAFDGLVFIACIAAVVILSAILQGGHA